MSWVYRKKCLNQIQFIIEFQFIFQFMQIVKQLGLLIEQATNDIHTDSPIALYEKVLDLINSRVDMPKHTINAISKRLGIKSKKVIYYCFDLLEYLSYRCELSLYSQISTKQFLLKLSGLLMNQDIDENVKTKILQTVKVWQELFRPHEDLLPMYFQFYAGLLRKEFPIQNNYASPHKPKDFKIYKASEQKKVESGDGPGKQKSKSRKSKVEASKSEQKTFQQIREKIIITNEIIDNVNPAEGVKGNQLLLEMMEEIKDSEQKINETINQNPNQVIMELALAANDDIYITYRRFKDLQKNRKPEPFIFAEMTSDILKEKEKPISSKKIEKEKPEPKKNSFEQKAPSVPKVQPKVQSKKEIDLFDVGYEPKKQVVSVASTNLMDLADLSMGKESAPPPSNVNIFDLLGDSSNQQQPSYNSNTYQMNNNNFSPAINNTAFQSNSFGTALNNNNTFQSNNLANITLASNFQTENDIAQYDGRTLHEKLTDLDPRDFFKK